MRNLLKINKKIFGSSLYCIRETQIIVIVILRVCPISKSNPISFIFGIKAGEKPIIIDIAYMCARGSFGLNSFTFVIQLTIFL